MHETHIRSSRDLRNHFPDIARLVGDKNQVVITRRGRGDMVLIDYREYKAYENYLRDRYFSEELQKDAAMSDDKIADK